MPATPVSDITVPTIVVESLPSSQTSIAAPELSIPTIKNLIVPTVLVESLPVSQTSNGAPKVSILATKSANAEQDVEEGKESNKHEISDRCLSECEVIKKFQKEILNECEVLIIFQQIVSIVARLEECGIIHGDLKADNILIDGNFKVTLIDFDASTYMEEKIVKGALRFDNIYPPSELKGHHQRMKEKYNTHKYEFISESDKKIAEEMTRLYEIGPVTTWTLGAILAQLLLLEPIIFWESTDLKALESKISASSISPPVKNLLFMCLNQDPNKRPNTKEILEYLYLNLPYIINNKKEISKKLESERFSIKITANPKAEVEFFPARRSCA
ncbi:hormonally up-regulated neu tumor-associated kinase-like [Artemia franciscana]|uniref:hormonally up-regulated neu tumor-associated kinase-like n=1 Tax=Artemia franciscana TaxID=6661 RepID=UPI0032D9DA70